MRESRGCCAIDPPLRNPAETRRIKRIDKEPKCHDVRRKGIGPFAGRVETLSIWRKTIAPKKYSNSDEKSAPWCIRTKVERSSQIAAKPDIYVQTKCTTTESASISV